MELTESEIRRDERSKCRKAIVTAATNADDEITHGVLWRRADIDCMPSVTEEPDAATLQIIDTRPYHNQKEDGRYYSKVCQCKNCYERYIFRFACGIPSSTFNSFKCPRCEVSDYYGWDSIGDQSGTEHADEALQVTQDDKI